MTLPVVSHSTNPASKQYSSVAKWELKANEVGKWATETCRTMSVQIVGEFDGAKCSLEGTNDLEAEGVKLSQQFDDDLTFVIPGFSGIRDIPRSIRPRVEGGGTKTNLQIYIHMVP